MQLLITIIALYESVFMFAFMLQMLIMVLEFIALMIKRKPMAQALSTCVSSFIESLPTIIAEAAAITLVSFLILSVI